MMMNEHGQINTYENGKTISETLEYADTLSEIELQRVAERSRISDEETRILLKDYAFDEFGNFTPIVHMSDVEG